MEPDTTFEKLDDNTLQMTVTPPAPEPVVTVYTIDEISKNIDNLTEQISGLQAELDNWNEILGRAGNIGIDVKQAMNKLSIQSSNQEIQL